MGNRVGKIRTLKLDVTRLPMAGCRAGRPSIAGVDPGGTMDSRGAFARRRSEPKISRTQKLFSTFC